MGYKLVLFEFGRRARLSDTSFRAVCGLSDPTRSAKPLDTTWPKSQGPQLKILSAAAAAAVQSVGTICLKGWPRMAAIYERRYAHSMYATTHTASSELQERHYRPLAGLASHSASSSAILLRAAWSAVAL